MIKRSHSAKVPLVLLLPLVGFRSVRYALLGKKHLETGVKEIYGKASVRVRAPIQNRLPCFRVLPRTSTEMLRVGRCALGGRANREITGIKTLDIGMK